MNKLHNKNMISLSYIGFLFLFVLVIDYMKSYYFFMLFFVLSIISGIIFFFLYHLNLSINEWIDKQSVTNLAYDIKNHKLTEREIGWSIILTITLILILGFFFNSMRIDKTTLMSLYHDIIETSGLMLVVLGLLKEDLKEYLGLVPVLNKIIIIDIVNLLFILVMSILFSIIGILMTSVIQTYTVYIFEFVLLWVAILFVIGSFMLIIIALERKRIDESMKMRNKTLNGL